MQMPVIGRLDEQVSRILIEPVGRQGPDQEQPAPGQQPPTLAPPAQTTGAAPPQPQADAKRDDELPVWLL